MIKIFHTKIMKIKKQKKLSTIKKFSEGAGFQVWSNEFKKKTNHNPSLIKQQTQVLVLALSEYPYII